jgi:hypothetical protein
VDESNHSWKGDQLDQTKPFPPDFLLRTDLLALSLFAATGGDSQSIIPVFDSPGLISHF